MINCKLLQMSVSDLDDESFDPSEEEVVLYLPHWSANLVRLFGAKLSKGEQLDVIIDQYEDENDDEEDYKDDECNKERSPTNLIHSATIPGDFSITSVLFRGQTMPKDEVRVIYTIAIDEFQLSIIDDNLDLFTKMAFEDYREAHRTHTHPHNTGRLTRA
ncbi:MAG: hypothetical protein EZS28_029522, partial [Streblomastix strix]